MWHAFNKHDAEVVVAGFFGAKGKRYKLLWMGDKERCDSVDILVAEKMMDSVSVERHSE